MPLPAAVLLLEFDELVADVEFELVAAELDELVVATVAEVVPAAADLLAERASAGSWPVISTPAISTQVAMNSATVAATTRWRIKRTRARRACLIAFASTRVIARIVTASPRNPVRAG